MKYLLLVFLLCLAGVAGAETDPRLAALEAALNRVQQEQQSVYQQFLMAQELRRNELQDQQAPSTIRNYSVMGTDANRHLDYDENVRLQRERQERLLRYERDINQAYSRYLELGYQKKVLLEQIMELAQPARR